MLSLYKKTRPNVGQGSAIIVPFLSQNEQGFTMICFNLCAVCLFTIGQYWPII
nr:MAG TPA: hypothetical protein [Caudoviricetes sp.]